MPVAVFGLGYVGLPLALSFAMRGCKVIGVDTNRELVGSINAGMTDYYEHYRGKSIREILKEQLEAGNFVAVPDASRAMRECKEIIVTVGIPVVNGRLETGFIKSCAREIAGGLKRGDLVLVRSTVTPGFTREVILPILESSGLKAGKDFYLAYSSERIAEGRAFEEFESMPALVGGLDPASTEKACKLLGIITKAEIYRASSFEVVETTKVIENISRDVNIALVNELARLTKAMNVDIFEVIELANTHKRVNLLKPGPGVGGYCIPNALYYLMPKAEEFKAALSLMEEARRVNDKMPAYVAGLVMGLLSVEPGKAKVAALGVAMKDYSSDDRLSPALKVIEILRGKGIEVAAFDPAVPAKYEFMKDSFEEALEGSHGAVILALQKGIDYFNLNKFKEMMSKEGTPFIVDTRNVYGRGRRKESGIIIESI